MPKKKTSKKKTTREADNKTCATCFFSRTNEFITDTVKCQRYPSIMKALPGHWCGEYKAK